MSRFVVYYLRRIESDWAYWTRALTTATIFRPLRLPNMRDLISLLVFHRSLDVCIPRCNANTRFRNAFIGNFVLCSVDLNLSWVNNVGVPSIYISLGLGYMYNCLRPSAAKYKFTGVLSKLMKRLKIQVNSILKCRGQNFASAEERQTVENALTEGAFLEPSELNYPILIFIIPAA